MKLFSQRKGLKPLEKAIQLDSLDQETRNRLWTVLKLCVWDKWNENYEYVDEAAEVQSLLTTMWFKYFKLPSDVQPPMHAGNYYRGKDYYTLLRERVLSGEWHEVFDVIEFALACLPKYLSDNLVKNINHVLTEEKSAYRVVSNQLVEITNSGEIQEVDAAAQTGLDGVSAHINAATKFLSDRKNPNYRNSIKESISAVESLFKIITNQKSGDLGDGLKELKKQFEIHPALLGGFEKIYAYTSDAGGIRHAIFDTDKTTFTDAKFMLVSCSAFINYVIGKYAESGKKIK